MRRSHSNFLAGLSLAIFLGGLLLLLVNVTGFLRIGTERRWFSIVPDKYGFELQAARRWTTDDDPATVLYFRNYGLGFKRNTTIESGRFWGRPANSVIHSVEIPYWFFVLATVPWPLAHR